MDPNFQHCITLNISLESVLVVCVLIIVSSALSNSLCHKVVSNRTSMHRVRYLRFLACLHSSTGEDHDSAGGIIKDRHNIFTTRWLGSLVAIIGRHADSIMPIFDELVII